MSGTADDGRLWWTMESDFDVAQFDKYAFNQEYYGPIATTVDHGQTSFTWRFFLFPKGAKFTTCEVRDHMAVGIQLDGGPVDKVGGVKFSIKVYKANGELEMKKPPGDAVAFIFLKRWWGRAKVLPMTLEHLRPYLMMTDDGVEYVRVRVELGIPKAAFEPLAMLPPLPTPHQDMAERFSRWSSSGDNMVKVVAGDDKRFTIHRGQLTEASDVFKAMLKTAMKEGNANCIHVDDLCGDALDELISYITFGATRPSRVRQHVLKLLDVAQRHLLPDLKVICERAIVEKLQLKKLPTDFLELLTAAEVYELRVPMSVGLCRLLNALQQLSEADQERFFNSEDFVGMRKCLLKLSNQSQLATKQ